MEVVLLSWIFILLLAKELFGWIKEIRIDNRQFKRHEEIKESLDTLIEEIRFKNGR